VTLNSPDFDGKTIEVDYWIAAPVWGRGIATEGVRLAIQYAFSKLGMNTVFSGTWERNPASGRVLEKNGFRAIDAVANDGQYGWKLLGQVIQRYQLDRSGI